MSETTSESTASPRTAAAPPGYTYGSPQLAASPVTEQDLAEIQASLLWSDADAEALQRAGTILIPRTEAILDVWYGFVGSQPHLVATFAGADGQPDADYLAAVRERFGRWIADVCTRSHDAQWLAYQEEIAQRHHPHGKNRTDAVTSTSSHIPLRHLVALVVPITVTVRDFLAQGESDPEEVDRMHQAWFKAITLSVVLWSRPYAAELW